MEEGGLDLVAQDRLVAALEQVGEPDVERVEGLDVALVVRRHQHRRRDLLLGHVEQQLALDEKVEQEVLVAGRLADAVTDLLLEKRLGRKRAEPQPDDERVDPSSCGVLNVVVSDTHILARLHLGRPRLVAREARPALLLSSASRCGEHARWSLAD
eukprot:scaffold30249_cov66-Phaeocystis_antarctica.AAC.1